MRSADSAQFLVWAPLANTVELHLVDPRDIVLPMTALADGYFGTEVACEVGSRYYYRLDGVDRPDPASRHQPLGVHGPSQIIGGRSLLGDNPPVLIDDYVLYELHVGTFTPEGTFAAAIEHLPRLKHLGITAVEVMPVAAFPGERNWGYDGVFPFAVHSGYGGLPGLQAFVRACHLVLRPPEKGR